MDDIAAAKRRPWRRRQRALGRGQERLPRVDVVFNPVSGHGDAVRERAQIADVLSRRYERVVFHETTPTVGAVELARAALRDGAAVLVASGGDGTVTAVAGALRDHIRAAVAKQRDAARAPGAPTPAVDGPKDSGAGAPGPGAPEKAPEEDGARPGNGAIVVRQRAREEPVGVSEQPRLGVIPRGTGNAFSAAVGIPSPVGHAAALVNRAPARVVDIATVNGEQPMMLLCGIGLEAETVKRANRELKSRFGPLAYFFAGLSSIVQEQRFKVNMVLEDVRQRTRVRGFHRVELASKEMRLTGVEVCALTVANAAPPSSVLAQGAGEVLPDDGLLEVVCVTPAGGPMATVRTMLRLLRSALTQQSMAMQPGVTGLRARRVRVECDPPQPVVVDGEDAGLTPVVVELSEDPAESQICVIAPKAGSVTRRRRRFGRALVRLWRNVRGIAMLIGTVAVVRSLKAAQVAAVPRRVRR